jgi:hypothetical protein
LLSLSLHSSALRAREERRRARVSALHRHRGACKNAYLLHSLEMSYEVGPLSSAAASAAMPSFAIVFWDTGAGA